LVGHRGICGHELLLDVTQILCSGLLFDMDGVLVDSTPAVARVWAWWAKRYGFDPEETVRRAHGRPSLTTIRELLPEGDHEAQNREVERREIEDVEGVVALPGALEILRAVPEERWAVVTSATRALAEVRLIAGGLPVPRKMVTWDDVKFGKPNPEPYLKGAEFLGVSAADCVVAEDAPAGIRAGKAAGARVVALRTTAEDAELLAAGADWIVDDLSKIVLQPRWNGGMLRLSLADASRNVAAK
jgi:mannitol-1-/sugar-/sorbitol-6-phosphatase